MLVSAASPLTLFWTDPQVIADFKQTIADEVEPQEHATGVVYKDDPGGAAWEKLTSPESTPVAPGYRGLHQVDRSEASGHRWSARRITCIPSDALTIPTSTSSTPPLSRQQQEHGGGYRRRQARRRIAQGVSGRRGRFRPDVHDPAAARSGHLEWSGRVLIWSLRIHSREGGFYWHAQPAGGSLYKAYHWPGFSTGDVYDERTVLTLLRQ